jgi:hypothetical protein
LNFENDIDFVEDDDGDDDDDGGLDDLNVDSDGNWYGDFD